MAEASNGRQGRNSQSFPESKPLHPVAAAWITLCCHADCPLLPPPLLPPPPPLISPPCLLASPAHLSPLPPPVLKSFEVHMWADSAYFSHTPPQFLRVTSAQLDVRREARCVIMHPDTLERHARLGHPASCQYCHVLYLSASTLCVSSSLGLRPLANQGLDLQSPHPLGFLGAPVSRLLA